LPFTLPARAARASPAPIDAATSPTVTGLSYLRSDPSGNRITVTTLPFDERYKNN
jgi:hypothetical protein